MMKHALHTILVSALISVLAGCTSGSSSANADEYQPRNEAAADQAKPQAQKAQPPAKVVIPAGAKLRVALLEGVSSDKSRAGDTFLASLTEPVVVGGKTVLAKGAKVRGRVMDAKESGRVQGRASLQLTLTEIIQKDDSVAISTKPYTAVAQATKKRDAEIIGGGAGLGAAIGAIAGGGKGAAIGAIAGGGAGTGTVLATKGKEIHYGPEHLLTFVLSNPVEL